MKKKSKTSTRKTTPKRKATAKAKQASPAKARRSTSRRAAKPAAETVAVRQGPTDEQIRIRAYERFLARGGQHGFAMDDWVAAERELTGEQSAQ